MLIIIIKEKDSLDGLTFVLCFILEQRCSSEAADEGRVRVVAVERLQREYKV